MAPSVELYACGFNAHNQLSFNTAAPEATPKDIHTLQKILGGTSIRLLFAGWSTTVVDVNGTLRSHSGFLKLPAGSTASGIDSVFGDHTGVLGALTVDGKLLLCKDDDGDEIRLECVDYGSNPDNASAKIAHLTIPGTGKVYISPFPSPSKSATTSIDQPPSTTTSSIAPSAPHLLQTHTSLPDLLHPPKPATTQTHRLPHPPTQLLSSASTLVALLPTGEIYTWGDPRHQHLGRTPTPSTPAQEPGHVTALGGIAIRKIASAGWMTGAVSRDGDLYVWGGRSGSSSGSGEGRISCLPSAEDEVALVDIEGGVDVVDVGVGAGHILALTGDGRVFAVGLNRNGQLGIGEESGFCEDWVEVPLEFGERKKVVGVECGYWSSFVLVRVV